MQATHRTYFRNLDAVRFLAFFLVFVAHAFISNNPAVKNSVPYNEVLSHTRLGLVGLDCFFVLSAFLITWIIFEERAAGKFNMKNFFVRRILRTWPLYFLAVCAGFAVAAVGGLRLPPLPHFIFFTLNFYIAEQGPYFLFFLVFLWSVAVEEQFYLFWGVALKYARRFFFELCASLILLSVFFRIFCFHENLRLVYHTASIAGDFGIGALIAYSAFHKNIFYRWISAAERQVAVMIYLTLLTCLVFYTHLFFNPVTIVFERLIFSCLFGFLIADQCFNTKILFNLGNWRVLSYLGRISYGLYIYHGMVITFFSKLAGKYGWDGSLIAVFLINPLIIFAVTVAVAMISYELFEKRIFKLKQKFY